MHKIKVYNNVSEKVLSHLDESKYTYSADMENYDAILVRSAKLHDVEFDPNLKCIARAGAGVNNIPLDRCAENGIVVFNTPGANANAVKELVICGLLLSARKVVQGANWAKTLEGKEDAAALAEKGKANYGGGEIRGKTLGVVGLGAIGIRVANAAEDLGMDVVGYDPYLSVEAALSLSRKVKYVKDLDELLAASDYITLHLPANAKTKGMINADAIEKMKDGVHLVNFARGELVNEADLMVALESKKVETYVSDFVSSNMLHLENAVLLPHLGASTEESEERCATMAVDEVREYLETGNIRNSVNFPNMNVTYEGGHRILLLHKNLPNTLSAILSITDSNVAKLGNRSKGDYACTILDIDDKPSKEQLEKLMGIEGMISVREIEIELQ